jgi:hypothetical protein
MRRGLVFVSVHLPPNRQHPPGKLFRLFLSPLIICNLKMLDACSLCLKYKQTNLYAALSLSFPVLFFYQLEPALPARADKANVHTFSSL